MPSGIMEEFKKSKVSGEVILSTSLASGRLGGLGNPKIHKAVMDTPSIPRGDLEAAYLEVALFAQEERLPKWRLWLDGFSITREFKPQYVLPVDDALFAKVLFDVTPIYKSENPRHFVTVMYDGSTPVTVGHINLLIIRRTEEAFYNFTYLSGAQALAPGEAVEIEAELEEEPRGRGVLRVVGILPSKSARVSVSVNGGEPRYLGDAVGADELSFEDLEISKTNRVKVEHLGSGTPYYPKHFILSTVLLGEAVYREPRIVFSDIVFEEGVLRAKVANVGESTPDSLFMVVMNMGIPLARLEVPSLKPGEVREVEFKLRLPHGTHNILLRAVARKLSKITYTDKRIQVSVG